MKLKLRYLITLAAIAAMALATVAGKPWPPA